MAARYSKKAGKQAVQEDESVNASGPSPALGRGRRRRRDDAADADPLPQDDDDPDGMPELPRKKKGRRSMHDDQARGTGFDQLMSYWQVGEEEEKYMIAVNPEARCAIPRD